MYLNARMCEWLDYGPLNDMLKAEGGDLKAISNWRDDENFHFISNYSDWASIHHYLKFMTTQQQPREKQQS